MKLLITSPSKVTVDHDDIAAIRAEDASGEFGLLPHHADFMTALSISVLSWRHLDGRQGYCAVRGGLLTVNRGEVAVATREAIVGDDLAALEAIVGDRLRADAEQDRQARAHSEHLRIQAIRQIVGYLRPGASDVRAAPS
ncbi:F-type H+-transporting ATPase subunit epsilon [Phenylobacterium haematophilum]|jgi:F-type H+-transporting ATPase subunit epsilon|uniref:F-type H+-transporting ATPase subunit epsilon n=1 Tax=Phenylobacterium haematophilum TaxID=98513 RepID=A0A840A5J1_9CAUL|nr:F0F1 ATP synthase subunit epsilon [Phenylobacterium haematophilum]MBB3892963.1 F-type H+-transporting ATPase subunit epsilon [Phenylobacterium haematophilum]